jgi:ribosomal protein L3
VRLFAFKTKKKELTCDELKRGRLEADTARTSLASIGTKLTPAQMSRSIMLAGEVGRELQTEFNRRCKTG